MWAPFAELKPLLNDVTARHSDTPLPSTSDSHSLYLYIDGLSESEPVTFPSLIRAQLHQRAQDPKSVPFPLCIRPRHQASNGVKCSRWILRFDMGGTKGESVLLV
jgi:hypothetical protein